MTDVVGRVARVLYEQQGAAGGVIHLRSWSRLRHKEQQAYRSIATAAIRALQPPSPAMIEAAKLSGAGGEDEEIAADFAAMLEAAVADSGLTTSGSANQP